MPINAKWVDSNGDVATISFPSGELGMPDLIAILGGGEEKDYLAMSAWPWDVLIPRNDSKEGLVLGHLPLDGQDQCAAGEISEEAAKDLVKRVHSFEADLRSSMTN